MSKHRRHPRKQSYLPFVELLPDRAAPTSVFTGLGPSAIAGAAAVSLFDAAAKHFPW